MNNPKSFKDYFSNSYLYHPGKGFPYYGKTVASGGHRQILNLFRGALVFRGPVDVQDVQGPHQQVDDEWGQQGGPGHEVGDEEEDVKEGINAGRWLVGMSEVAAVVGQSHVAAFFNLEKKIF